MARKPPPTSPDVRERDPDATDRVITTADATEAAPPRRKTRTSRSTRTVASSPVLDGPGAEPAPRAAPRPREAGAEARRPRASRGTRDEDQLLPRVSLRDADSREAPRAPRAPDSADSRDTPDARPPVPAGPPVPPRYAVSLNEDRIDPDVGKVVRRLVRHGYEAYLVGGCVRDLLLDRRPKDFDVATSARPEQVRELFRNSRVIGRRFRLVHVLFHGGKVIEVATFRKNPNTEEAEEGAAPDSTSHLLIRSDNVFGEAHEDAQRRDFTINALFYDVEAAQTLDWVGGLRDIEGHVVNTIGEPNLRFREDPVRILRALKFAGRLDLGISPEVYDAIVACRGSLELAARPRVAEEVLRLLRGGGARRTMYLAWETGVLDVLMPELAALLYDSFGAESQSSSGHRFFRLLEFIDKKTKEQGPRDDTVLWTLLLLEPLKEAVEGVRDRSAASAGFLEPMLERLAIPRRFADGMRRILAVLPRILSGRAGRFARTELFDLALEVAEADLFARGLSLAPIDALRLAAREAGPEPRTDNARNDRRPEGPDAPRNRPRGEAPARSPSRAPARMRPTPRH